MKLRLLTFIALFLTGSTFAMQISSPDFSNNSPIPFKYTCDNQNISPELNFSQVPLEAVSLALIMDDPDAPMGTWTHWVLYNMPPQTKQLSENIASLPNGTQVAFNSWNNKKYGGPCPPSGEHRYFFKLYALDTLLAVDEKMTSEKLQKLIKGHILAEATLMGRYERK